MKIFVNLITTFRFGFALILPLLKTKVSNVFFIMSIIALFLTDSIDGILARKFKVQTLYGSMMDTVADKTLSIVLLLMLVKKVDILSIVLLCEILIAIINIVGMAIGKKTQSSLLGKAKMWVLSITIVLSYMNLFNIIDYNIVIFSSVITIIMQIFVTMGYIKSLIKQKGVVNKKQPIRNIQELRYILFDTKYYMSIM